jgi:hypothetical protein
MAAFLAYMSEFQRLLGAPVRLLQATSSQMRFPEGETTERLRNDH